MLRQQELSQQLESLGLQINQFFVSNHYYKYAAASNVVSCETAVKLAQNLLICAGKQQQQLNDLNSQFFQEYKSWFENRMPSQQEGGKQRITTKTLQRKPCAVVREVSVAPQCKQDSLTGPNVAGE